MIWLLLSCQADTGDAVYTGTIEVTEIEVASTMGGRLVEVLPQEGEHLDAGAPVFRLDASLVVAENELRSAGIQQANAAREAAGAQVRAASASAGLLRRELARVRKLEAAGVGSAQQSSQLSGQLDVANAQVAAAQELVKQAEAAVQQAEAGLNIAAIHLSETTVSAAVQGVVLSRNREPGEIVAPGMSVITLGDLSHPRLRIYVPLARVEALSLGDAVEVRLEDHTTTGTITRIGSQAEFTPREILTPDERVKRVFAVDIALTPGPGIHPGMPADARLAD
jgi:HlyD family secretion protein